MLQDDLANFIETENISYFTSLLDKETHPEKRKLLRRLLAEQRATRAARLAGSANAQGS